MSGRLDPRLISDLAGTRVIHAAMFQRATLCSVIVLLSLSCGCEFASYRLAVGPTVDDCGRLGMIGRIEVGIWGGGWMGGLMMATGVEGGVLNLSPTAIAAARLSLDALLDLRREGDLRLRLGIDGSMGGLQKQGISFASRLGATAAFLVVLRPRHSDMNLHTMRGHLLGFEASAGYVWGSSTGLFQAALVYELRSLQ